MNSVNKTLYIPLYGKAAVSKKGIILHDPKAELIWEKEGFTLHGKAKSKWLTYYMGMRSAVFDRWVREQLENTPEALVLHIGCGMDSRVERIGKKETVWYDVDFPSVIEERRKYYRETENYRMLAADARQTDWIRELPACEHAVVVMEGVSMYFQIPELLKLLTGLKEHFDNLTLLMDCYTEFAVKASKYKNPIKDVRAQVTSGLDDPEKLTDSTGMRFTGELDMTPNDLINELKGFERAFFKTVLGGKMSKKMYRLYEFETKETGREHGDTEKAL